MRALPKAVDRYFRERGHVLAFCALLVALPGLFSEPPPATSLEGLAALLGRASGLHVSREDIVWEPRRGLLADLTRGRGLLFLGAQRAGMARDLYRARVRLTPGGQPLAVTRVLGLTDTPLADECGLSALGSHAAFATASGQRVQAVTVLGGLGGARSASGGLLARLAAASDEGSFVPLERTDLLLETPAARATLTLADRALTVELDPAVAKARYDLERRALDGGSAGFKLLARDQPLESTRIAWLDLVRSWFGTSAVTLVGRAFYGVSDLFRRVRPASRADPGESRWQPIARNWLKLPAGLDRSSGTPEPLFRKRILRPDAARSGSRLVLVGLDLRQLELGMQAGVKWPHSTTGVAGEGRTPRDPELVRRIVGVFNAGPEAPYDRYGAKAGGRVLVPALAGKPGILLDATHGVAIERFAFGSDVPAGIVAFAQRETALVEAGVASSGEGSPLDRSVRRRTALCTTRGGELFYAFAEALDAAALARGLLQAGCDHALPLATGPERLGFALADFARVDQGRFELVDDAMDLEPKALVAGTTRDFFYVLLRDGQPKNPPGARWAKDGGTQPAPEWLPGILKTELRLGALTIELLSIEHGGVNFRLRAGASEIGARGEPWVGVLSAEDQARALLTLELGHATAATRYGLVLGTLIPLALKPAYATLVLGDAAPPRILLPSEPVTLGVGEQAVQLPLLADDGDVTQRARERGDFRPRSALCVSAEGRLVIATLRHDSSDPLAVALRSAGCRRVVELDRGSHHPAFLGRAGTDQPTPTDPKTTTLWVLAKPQGTER
jgi:hypothetical protein